MVSVDHFKHLLLSQMRLASDLGRIDICINSGELHRSFGNFPRSICDMPACCDAMQDEMKVGDTMLLDRANGVGMTVRYLLPRGAPT